MGSPTYIILLILLRSITRASIIATVYQFISVAGLPPFPWESEAGLGIGPLADYCTRGRTATFSNDNDNNTYGYTAVLGRGSREHSCPTR